MGIITKWPGQELEEYITDFYTANVTENGEVASEEGATTEDSRPASATGDRPKRSLKNKRGNPDLFGSQSSVVKAYKPKPHMGVRKQRRYEHLKTLMSLTTMDDVCDDFSDMLPDSCTGFAQLFLEKESMMVWNSFVEKTEAEQRRILSAIEEGQELEILDQPSHSASFEHISHDDVAKLASEDDKRTVHPAYSSEECFDRISHRLKAMLRHKARGLPLGQLEALEEQLTDYFLSGGRDAVWVSELSCPFARLMVHLVAQWLGLTSRSMASQCRKEVHVECHGSMFVPPEETLASYLAGRRGKMKGGVSCGAPSDGHGNTGPTRKESTQSPSGPSEERMTDVSRHEETSVES